MSAETFLVRTEGGPLPGDRTSAGPWPLPETLPLPGGRYVKVRESQLAEGHPHVLRGAEYRWEPEAERAPARPVYRPPADGETSAEASARRAANRADRDAWHAWWSAPCRCGLVRGNVAHEQDPEHSIEGPAYHAEFEHHAFEPAP